MFIYTYIYILRHVHTYIYACVLMQFMYVEYMRPSQSQSDEKPERTHFGCATTCAYRVSLVV